MLWSEDLCPPPTSNLHVEILITKGMVLENGAFGSWLSHEDGALAYGINALRKGTLEMSLTPCEHSGTTAI